LTTASGPRSAAIPARPEGAWLVVRLENPGRTGASSRDASPPTLDLDRLILYHNGTREPVAETIP
jgi:hypothetical protein